MWIECQIILQSTFIHILLHTSQLLAIDKRYPYLPPIPIKILITIVIAIEIKIAITIDIDTD